MCIAIYKPEQAAFPSKQTLQRCFTANPDGAGYMFAAADLVHIRKGFETFKDFWRDLQETRTKHGEHLAAVLHFRISTQGGIRPDCTHPFPLSRKMEDLRALRTSADMGVAHNGIISLTSVSHIKQVTYSDTMTFITEYAARLIKSRDWHTDPDLVAVVESLADSKLAILDGGGHCTLIGQWVEDGGVFFSNYSYLPAPPRKVYAYTSYDEWGEWGRAADLYPDIAEAGTDADPYTDEYDPETGLYFFDDISCPATTCGIADYCDLCASKAACYGIMP